jgi:hypothetical protein
LSQLARHLDNVDDDDVVVVVVVIWHCMASFPSWYKQLHFATDATTLVERKKCSNS